MTNLSKNGSEQTALNLGGPETFDEAAYRERLIKAGIAPDDAASVAAKTAAAQKQAGFTPVKVGAAIKAAEQPKPAPTATPTKAATARKRAPAKTPAKKTADKPRILTVQESKLMDVAAEIATIMPTGDDMAFTHAVLCQVGLPRSKVNGREFMRQSGAAWVNIQAGYLDEGKGAVQQPLPYGVMPRLALAWLSSYAKRHSTREIPIGDSAAEFLRIMGMDDQGARYTTLRRQMHALAACRLQLGYRGRTFNGQPVQSFDAWVANRDDNQRALWPGVMTLSESYFMELQDTAVPLDNRALHALKGSALALDVYCWLAHRLHRIEGRGVTLHWKSLREQFAQEYKGKDPDKDFKKAFLPVLRKVQAVYPAAKVKQVTGGLLLMGSPPPVPKKIITK